MTDILQHRPAFQLSHSVFRHLPQDLTDEIFSKSEVFQFSKHEIIYRQGSRISGCYFILYGIIKIFKTGADGKEQIIRFAKPGELIAFRSLFSSEPACTTAMVHEDCLLLYIPAEIIFHLVKTNGQFAIDLIQLICKELGEANEYITDIAQKTVRERLAEVIVQLQKNFGTDSEGFLAITLTREELANIVGTATESVIRLLSEFKEDRLIELKGRKTKILNNQAILKLANFI